jgi:hypothetical protein
MPLLVLRIGLSGWIELIDASDLMPEELPGRRRLAPGSLANQEAETEGKDLCSLKSDICNSILYCGCNITKPGWKMY